MRLASVFPSHVPVPGGNSHRRLRAAKCNLRATTTPWTATTSTAGPVAFLKVLNCEPPKGVPDQVFRPGCELRAQRSNSLRALLERAASHATAEGSGAPPLRRPNTRFQTRKRWPSDVLKPLGKRSPAREIVFLHDALLDGLCRSVANRFGSAARSC